MGHTANIGLPIEGEITHLTPGDEPRGLAAVESRPAGIGGESSARDLPRRGPAATAGSQEREVRKEPPMPPLLAAIALRCSAHFNPAPALEVSDSHHRPMRNTWPACAEAIQLVRIMSILLSGL